MLTSQLAAAAGPGGQFAPASQDPAMGYQDLAVAWPQAAVGDVERVLTDGVLAEPGEEDTLRPLAIAVLGAAAPHFAVAYHARALMLARAAARDCEPGCDAFRAFTGLLAEAGGDRLAAMAAPFTSFTGGPLETLELVTALTQICRRRTACRPAEDVPALAAAAAPPLAAWWKDQAAAVAAEADRLAGEGTGPACTAPMTARAVTLEDCVTALRRALAAGLLGKDAPDAG